jgi:hypothetical protein
MTREEAIYLLNNLRSVAEGKEDEAIDMAIEALSADVVSREEYDKLIQELNDSPKGKWIPLNGKLPKIIGDHVLVTIKWADDDLEVCEMCPTNADRYNIIAFQKMPLPYDGEPLKSELQTSCERAEQTNGYPWEAIPCEEHFKMPHEDEVMGALDKLTIRPQEETNCVECKHYTETEDDDGVHGHCDRPKEDEQVISKCIPCDAEVDDGRPHGEWYQIKDHKVMGEGYLWHCSICDYKVYQDSSADYPSENFCPNCGSDMRQKESGKL